MATSCTNRDDCRSGAEQPEQAADHGGLSASTRNRYHRRRDDRSVMSSVGNGIFRKEADTTQHRAPRVTIRPRRRADNIDTSTADIPAVVSSCCGMVNTVIIAGPRRSFSSNIVADARLGSNTVIGSLFRPSRGVAEHYQPGPRQCMRSDPPRYPSSSRTTIR